jgi:RecB family exonuclease
MRPSIFLDEVLDLYREPGSEPDDFSGLPHSILRLDAQGAESAAPRSPRREQRSTAALLSNGGHSSERALLEALRRASCGKEPISLAVAQATEDRVVFSASEIEMYLQCPFRWCVDRMVKPRELDDRFDRSAAGRLGHDIMKRFYDRFIERSGLPRVTPEALPLARSVHAEVADIAQRDAGAVTTAEAAAVRAVTRQTLRLVESDAHLLPGFAPTYREWPFGAGDDPAEPFAGFSLAGRIDRMDTSTHGLVVTDYKSGTSVSTRALAKFEAEGIVQLPLYAAVAARRLGLTVAGGMYRPIGGGKPRGFVSEALRSADFVRTDIVGDDVIASAIDAAEQRAALAVERMRAGDIRPDPRGGSCPGYCAARGFCPDWRPARG